MPPFTIMLYRRYLCLADVRQGSRRCSRNNPTQKSERPVQCLRHMASSTTEPESPLQFLNLQNGRRIAYRHTPAISTSSLTSRISILFLPGWMGTMGGGKARSVEQLSRKMGWEFARFDYEGVGESPGEVDEMTLTDWKNNALGILDQILRPETPVVLVGSSMGGWLSMHLARLKRKRIAGIVAIAPALDFLVKYVKTLPENVQMRIDAGELVSFGVFGEKRGQKLSKRLVDDATRHHLLDLPSLDVRCPVRILHGMRDETVPWSNSLKLVNHLESEDVELVLRKAGDHRLSTDEDISILTTVVSTLVKSLNRSCADLI